jgi:hypothetical protein
MRIYQYGGDNVVNLPVTGGGSAIVAGALLKRGISGTQPLGALQVCSGNSTASPDVVGILREAHATADDTDAAGTIFKTHPVQLIQTGRLVLAEYSLSSSFLITCTQAVSTTTITLTNLEDDIDTGALYVAAGLGIGQMNYLTAAASGSATLKAAFGTALDTTSKLVKILPRFHQKASFTTDGTKLASQDVVGVQNVSIVDTLIEKNNRFEQFNPVKHSALTGLNSLRDFHIYAVLALRDSFFYTID